MLKPDQRHQVVIIGGGTGGITVAARLKRAGLADVALIEPGDTHYYQPLWIWSEVDARVPRKAAAP